MDAYYHNQATMPHFSGHYRQRGSGFGALAMGIGRVALPLARKFIIPAAKRIGNELFVQAAPELINIATKKKTPKQALKSTVKNTIKKQVGSGKKSARKIKKRKTSVKRIRKKPAVPFQRNELYQKVALISSPECEMISNLIPTEATHSSLDLFEKPPLLVTFEKAFNQKVGPSYSPDGPMLEFEVLRDRNNFIDLQRTRLEIVLRVVQNNGNVLRTHATDAGLKDTPYLVNNPLSFLFSECTLSLNGEKISTINANFAHKSFIETEVSHGNDAKKTWLACQGYYYEDNPANVDDMAGRAVDVAELKRLVAASVELRLFGKIACDFLSCDKHLISGVTARLSLKRSPNDFVVMPEDNGKHYQVQITEANLYVRKMTVKDFVLSSIEKTLLKSPAIYNYIEVLPRTFLATTGVQSLRQEDVFAKEPLRRMIVAMSTNEAYLGTNRSNPFH